MFKDWFLKEGLTKIDNKVNDKSSSELVQYMNSVDKKYLNSKTTSNLEEKLKTKLMHLDNIDLFVQIGTDEENYGLTIKSKSSKANNKMLFDKMCNKNNLNPNKTIIFIKDTSSGDVLTPWMLLHTFAHGIEEHTSSFQIGRAHV